MTQEEVIKLAQEAGFGNYAYEAAGIFARFAAIVSANEREKCTGTQEFVTLPREVVEQAISALKSDDEIATAFYLEISALCTALEQPQAVTNCHQSDYPQGEQEPVAWIRTEWSSRTLNFDGPPTAPSVRDELTKPVWTPLYTHQQHKREPLTDDQIDAIADAMPDGLEGFMKGWGWRQFAYAVIEAANNIK